MARIFGSQSCGDTITDTKEEYGLFCPCFFKGIARDLRPGRPGSDGSRYVELQVRGRQQKGCETEAKNDQPAKAFTVHGAFLMHGASIAVQSL
ncbi:MAG: hypothetical protein ACK52L_24330 [Pirellula sp.]